MSPQMRVTRSGKLKPVRHRAIQPWPMIWLVLFWMGLWGSWSPSIVLTGVVAAFFVVLAFPLPPVSIGARVRVLPLLWLIVHFLVDVVRASFLVSVVVLRRRPVKNAIVTVDLHSDSDFVLTAVAAMLTLVPGSIVVEARRSTHTLYLHVLDVDDEEAVEKFRAEAFAVEQRFLRAFEPLADGDHPEGPAQERT